jgi:hypothetical protein
MRRLSHSLITSVAILAILLLSGCTASKPKPRVYSLGERVDLGRLTYKAFETQWLTQAGEGVSAHLPQNRFFLIRVAVTSSSTGDIYIPPIVLENDAGKVFDEIDNGDQLPSWLGLVRKVKPVEPLQGNVIFDVPAGHYRMKVSDDAEQQTAYIDIPLTYGAESGPMTLPESGVKGLK